jgi:hypothetical protein
MNELLMYSYDPKLDCAKHSTGRLTANYFRRKIADQKW